MWNWMSLLIQLHPEGSIQLRLGNLQGSRWYHLPVLSCGERGFHLPPFSLAWLSCLDTCQDTELAPLASLTRLCLRGSMLPAAPIQVRGPHWHHCSSCRSPSYSSPALVHIEWSVPIWCHMQLYNDFKKWRVFKCLLKYNRDKETFFSNLKEERNNIKRTRKGDKGNHSLKLVLHSGPIACWQLWWWTSEALCVSDRI